MTTDDALLGRLRAIFRVEADERLKTLQEGLIELDEEPTGERVEMLLEQMFRALHSLKGAAGAVRLSAIESLCQPLETLFASLEQKNITVSAPLIELLNTTLATLTMLIEVAQDVEPPALDRLITQLEDAAKGEPIVLEDNGPTPTSTPTPPEAPADRELLAPATEPPPRPATVRVATKKLDQALNGAEQLLTAKLAAGARVSELRRLDATMTLWNKQRIKIEPMLRLARRLLARAASKRRSRLSAQEQREFADLIDYVEGENLSLKAFGDELTHLARAFEDDRRALAVMVDHVIADIKEMYLQPIRSRLDALPLLVDELASAQGKEVELVVHGADIEVDRRILEDIQNPLIHLLRNSIDHGIEPPLARTRRGKPARATIVIDIAQKDSGKIEILIADDGTGVDLAGVGAAAVRLGIASADAVAKTPAAELAQLVFRVGLSTSQMVTRVSGRGRGLAIVREKVEQLGGTIDIDTAVDAGTRFRLLLPVTLATVRCLLVRCEEQLFALPLAQVESALHIGGTTLSSVAGRTAIIRNGEVVAFADLAETLAMPREQAPPAVSVLPVVVVCANAQRVALGVDQVIGEEEVLVKSLGRQLARVPNIAGACVLGNGEMAIVLNVADLVLSAHRCPSLPRVAMPAQGACADKVADMATPTILVVEDSVTSRTRLRKLLQSAGYRVDTAVDGMDAYAKLKIELFDLVVSDIDMPRMDGFDLTARIRANRRLLQLPVVLVTSTESAAHRKRGIEAGADAYIAKENLDQRELVVTIQNLIGRRTNGAVHTR